MHNNELPHMTLIVGNPKPKSRTLDAGLLLINALYDAKPDCVIDLATYTTTLIDSSNDILSELVTTVSESQLVVIASPTFKATYTGLLKLFLERFETSHGLRNIVCIPMMLGGASIHSLAPDTMLRPLISELGGTCPTPGLYLLDSSYKTDGVIQTFATRWKPTIDSLTRDPAQ